MSEDTAPGRAEQEQPGLTLGLQRTFCGEGQQRPVQAHCAGLQTASTLPRCFPKGSFAAQHTPWSSHLLITPSGAFTRQAEQNQRAQPRRTKSPGTRQGHSDKTGPKQSQDISPQLTASSPSDCPSNLAWQNNNLLNRTTALVQPSTEVSSTETETSTAQKASPLTLGSA